MSDFKETLRLLSKNCRENDTLTKFACFTEEADAIDAALEYIAALESASKDAIRGEAWISVDERLPGYGKWVLFWFVTVDPKNAGVVMGQRSSHEEGKYWDAAGLYRDLSFVTHWMPLPEAPAALSQKVGDQQ